MRALLLLASVMGFFAIVLGAYGSHGLAAADHLRQNWQLAAYYQLLHAVVIAIYAVLINYCKARMVIVGAVSIVVGIILFCGTLYMKALTNGAASGYLAPYGGVSLMLGWIMLGVCAATKKKI